ncbi:unnamed protein product, partial [Mesorhabditis belari]|uniref:SAM domain-containing protein n=1 Tax=Mesorhabditis belari TaxID=2138241 RepID=A0AAF3EIB7_9BILA
MTASLPPAYQSVANTSKQRRRMSGGHEIRPELSMASNSTSIHDFHGIPIDPLLYSAIRHFRPISQTQPQPETRSGRSIIPYTTRHSDSGFSSVSGTGKDCYSSHSSCSLLPPPPPYRHPASRSHQTGRHRIHRSFSDSKYQQASALLPTSHSMALEAARKLRGASWQQSRASVTSYEPNSPSPSMSTVSCPDYPELQEKLNRLSMARDSLALQVAVLTEQVSAQKEKIRDLEAIVTASRGKQGSHNDLGTLESLSLQEEADIDFKKMDLIAEVSNLKLKYASLEREKSDTERKLRVSQNEIERLADCLHGIGPSPSMIQSSTAVSHQNGPPPPNPYAQMAQRTEKQQDEMEHLRHAVTRLIADNEAKNVQINSLRNALDEHCRQRDDCYAAPVNGSSANWPDRPHQPHYDINAQLRRLLMDEPLEMAHSTSFPMSLCSSTHGPDRRSAVQSSSSYTSSLSTASPQHSWSQSGTPSRSHNLLHPQAQQIANYRSPSSPAARQLAAELDELRRLGDHINHQHHFASTTLPRGMGVKAASTLAIPGKKLSVASSTGTADWPPKSKEMALAHPRTTTKQEAGDLGPESSRERRRSGERTGATLGSQSSKLDPSFKRDRTRSSLRNLFSKLTRSSSQDHHQFRRGSQARSTSAARLGGSGPLSGAIALRPAVSHFVDWKSEQITEWIGEIGYPQYQPEVSEVVRSGRHLLNMNADELERELGIKNPLHRKRILLILRRIEEDVLEPVDKFDLHQVLRWLEDVGLPQYKDTFAEYLIDGITLEHLTAADIVEMRITNGSHYATLCRSIQFLKAVNFRPQALDKKFDPTTVSRYPCPNSLVRWAHSTTCEWLRTIDLSEFTPNLLCAGVPGALLVYEPTFTAESLAEMLQIPPHKTLLRRHLTSHFNQLLGQKLIAEKRDFLAQGIYPQLMPSLRIKVVKKGFSLTRKKAKNEICVEPEEMLAPPDLRHKFPMSAQSLLESLDASNV